MGEGRADGEGCADIRSNISTALFGLGAVLMGKAVLILVWPFADRGEGIRGAMPRGVSS